MLRFDDGVNVETSGKLRTLKLHDGWYVTGQGLLIPCGSHKEASETLERIRGDERCSGT